MSLTDSTSEMGESRPMPSRHNGKEEDESERVTRYRTTMQQRSLIYSCSKPTVLMYMRISGYLLGESVDSKGQLVFQGCIILIRW